MNKVYVVGIGPGGAEQITPQARTAMERAEVLCGYMVYIDLVRPLYPGKEVFTTPMTREIERCRRCLEFAQSGRTTAMLCSGDAGVYGMAGPLLQLCPEFPEVEVEVVPGVTAALSGGAGGGAPGRPSKTASAAPPGGISPSASTTPPPKSGRTTCGRPVTFYWRKKVGKQSVAGCGTSAGRARSAGC